MQKFPHASQREHGEAVGASGPAEVWGWGQMTAICIVFMVIGKWLDPDTSVMAQRSDSGHLSTARPNQIDLSLKGPARTWGPPVDPWPFIPHPYIYPGAVLERHTG